MRLLLHTLCLVISSSVFVGVRAVSDVADPRCHAPTDPLPCGLVYIHQFNDLGCEAVTLRACGANEEPDVKTFKSTEECFRVCGRKNNKKIEIAEDLQTLDADSKSQSAADEALSEEEGRAADKLQHVEDVEDKLEGLMNRCHQPPETGLCRAMFPRFFYNSTDQSCQEFIYGGCGGNGNNFFTQLHCKLSCPDEIPCKSDTQRTCYVSRACSATTCPGYPEAVCHVQPCTCHVHFTDTLGEDISCGRSAGGDKGGREGETPDGDDDDLDYYLRPWWKAVLWGSLIAGVIVLLGGLVVAIRRRTDWGHYRTIGQRPVVQTVQDTFPAEKEVVVEKNGH